MFALDGVGAGDEDAEEPARHRGGVERREQPADDGHAIGLAAVNGRADVERGAGPGAIEQGQGQIDPRAVGKLDQLEGVADHLARGDGDVCHAPLRAHRRAPGTSMSRTAPAWTRATSSSSAVSMYSSGPPMLWTAGP